VAVFNHEEEHNSLGLFMIISLVLHLFIILFFPQLYGKSSNGMFPMGDKTMQLSIRVNENTDQSVILTPTVEPSIEYSPSLQPNPKPDAKPPVTEPTPTQVVQNRTEVVQPVFNPNVRLSPEPKPEVVVEAPEVTPEVPQTTTEIEIQPEVTDSGSTVMTNDSGSVAVNASDNEVVDQQANAQEITVQQVYGEEVVPEGVMTASVESSPPPPPPPPAASSVLQLPGPSAMPKNLVLAKVIQVRVFIQIDENGNIINASVDPLKSSGDETIDYYAIEYAKRNVKAQALQSGQAYRASIIVTFDPNERARGVSFDHDDSIDYQNVIVEW
jgi:TonB family protein